jgi:hypothetical protein
MLRDNGVTLGLQGNPIQENHVYSEGVLWITMTTSIPTMF